MKSVDWVIALYPDEHGSLVPRRFYRTVLQVVLTGGEIEPFTFWIINHLCKETSHDD